MRGPLRFHLLALPPLACAIALASGCSSDKKTSGELIVAIQTDMSLPKDVDQVRIDVRSFGNVVFKNTYPVGAGGLRIPATLGVLPGADARALITIRVIAFQRGKPRMLREVVTTVPESRLGTLRLPIQWLSDGSATQPDPTNEEDIRSSCNDGNTDIAGECVPWDIDSSTLPDYKAEDVFGGGKEDGTGGSCFDTLDCIGAGAHVEIDAATCTATLLPGVGADPSKVNFGLVLPLGSDGVCDARQCYVPLDASSNSGWTTTSGAGAITSAKLPKKVCDKLATGAISDVSVSSKCASKLPGVPTCGPWSSVSGGGGTGGGGITADSGVGPPTCSDPVCKTTPATGDKPSLCDCSQTCDGTRYALVCDGSFCVCTADGTTRSSVPQSTTCLDPNQESAALAQCRGTP
ncbi:MAG: putative rane protein [Myxococcaceae bacterium]|nr:putative rane protein [Myxococcaceae bacterium]